MQPIESKVDWNGVKACLGTLFAKSPEFLSRSVVIGGGACWFYRTQLRRANDPDFREPTLTEAQERLWLSKDIDFTGIFRGDAAEMLAPFVTRDQRKNSYLEVNGIRLGFAQVGVTFDPEEIFRRARIGEFEMDGAKAQFLVIDPVSLYREKQALAEKRNRPNDHLHLQVVREEVALEFVNGCAAYVAQANQSTLADKRRQLGFLLDVKNRAMELLADPRVRRRIEVAVTVKSEAASFIRKEFLLESS